MSTRRGWRRWWPVVVLAGSVGLAGGWYVGQALARVWREDGPVVPVTVGVAVLGALVAAGMTYAQTRARTRRVERNGEW